MNYRAEIDGLRALAVIPVILFHAGFDYFRGGFVGVDIFFVISGYLITLIILSEKEKGHFSLLTFYERRMRRILPALFFVVFATLPMAWLWLMPEDLKDFSQSLMAVATFSSNILFWTESGYWGIENSMKPLLHTWSLGVEEQYYLLFPLFLMALWKFNRQWIIRSFGVVLLGSFALALWAGSNDPSANFYFLPTRAWELAMGAGIAFYTQYRYDTLQTLTSNTMCNEIFSAVGLLFIFLTVAFCTENIPHPGIYTLIPTLGTALLILFASPATLIGRLLGSRIFVSIGLISYSTYLWHQPLFSFARHSQVLEPGPWQYFALTLLSFVLAWFTWKYIETPFRTKDAVSRKKLFILAIVSSLILIIIGFVGHITDGVGNRKTNYGITLASLEESRREVPILNACKKPLSPTADCMTAEHPDILIWGDSFARQLTPGILASNPDAGIIQMTMDSCGPFFDMAPIVLPNNPARNARNCLAFNQQLRQWLQSGTSIKYAVLSSPFARYLRGGKVLLRDGKQVDAHPELALQEFENTLKELKALGIQPIIFSPPPANQTNLARCLARAEAFGVDMNTCNFRIGDMAHNRVVVYDFLEIIGQHHPVVHLDKLLCDQTTCYTHLGSTFLYKDSAHLSSQGSSLLGKRYDFYGLVTGAH